MSGAIPFDVDDNPTSKSWINVLSAAGDHDILNCNQKKKQFQTMTLTWQYNITLFRYMGVGQIIKFREIKDKDYS